MTKYGDVYFYNDAYYGYVGDYISMFGEHIYYLKNFTTNKNETISLYDYKFWENAKEVSTYVSKYLSYILRHKPESIGLQLDKEGWGDVQYIIDNAEMILNKNLIEYIVIYNDKNRFSLSKDKTKIRANQGHTTKNVDIKFKKSIPPITLYHGTKEDNIPSILKKGLLPMERQYVHLSKDIETAKKVGDRRKGKTVILSIDTKQMLADGIDFYISDNDVLLVKEVDKKYISIL